MLHPEDDRMSKPKNRH